MCAKKRPLESGLFVSLGAVEASCGATGALLADVGSGSGFATSGGGVFLLHGGLAAHLDAAFFVDADALGGDDVAGLHHVFGLVDTEVSELANVDEAVFLAAEVHEGTEVRRADNAARVELADFDLLELAADHFDCAAWSQAMAWLYRDSGR